MGKVTARVSWSWLQIQQLGADLHPGDVLLSNHPSAGGSHLPDLTVITPVRGTAQGPVEEGHRCH